MTQENTMAKRHLDLLSKKGIEHLYCIIGKCKRNNLPHVISCAIGIDSADQAKTYAKQLAKTKAVHDARMNLYQWTKPMLLSDAIKDENILVFPNDKRRISDMLTFPKK